MFRVLGVDPGLQYTGWAIIEIHSKAEDVSYVNSGVIKTNSDDKLSKRLHLVHTGISEVVRGYKVKYAAIEETFVNKNFSSSLKLSQARAAALLTLEILDLNPAEYASTLIKKTITGNGHADKENIFKMLKLIIKNIDKLKRHDEADAIAIALCHLYLNRRGWN